MRYQPQGRIEVDSVPLAANLEFLYVGCTPIEVVKNRVGSFLGTSAYRAGVGGKTVAFDGSSRSIVFPRDARLEIASGFTAWAYVYIPSYTPASANDDFFCKAFNNNASAPFLSWSLGNGSGSGGGVSTAIKAAIGIGSSLFTAEMTCNVGLNLIGLTYDGANLRGWVGGVNKATTAATGSVNYDTSSAGNLIIGGSSGASVNKDFRGDVYAAGFHSRVFSQSDFTRLADNPWQLFKAPGSADMDGSSSATIIDLTVASLSYSAKSPQTRLTSTLTAASLTTTAKAIQPQLSTGLTAASMPMTGCPLQMGAIVRLGVAAMGFTAQAITLVRDTAIQLSAATLAFSAKAISVTFDGMAIAIGNWKRGLQSRRNHRNSDSAKTRQR